MQQIRPDLWITAPYFPEPEGFPDLKFHGYFLTRPEGNLLIHTSEHAADHDIIAQLGGVSRQYLAHGHEAEPGIARIRQRFGSTLLAHRAASADVAVHAELDHPLDGGEVFDDGVTVIATPGHTASNVAFKVRSKTGETYLFVGDTIFPRRGEWHGAVFPDEGGDTATLQDSLARLADHHADLILFGVTISDEPARQFTASSWRAALDEASRSLQPI
ncbi:MBL fold metallo-hydrolase [Roseinatronobacter alkalisoli]|uniref:Metallo-beta-lactamase domain-containing protein n=1 Tax=Roseinatronobacter alkalisoli TaxID=3028235 RepID=A0ABT5T9J6_9RHOB|nr:MBL fold metallo-hydrolase [Roseinatronobacter sp. HJB301]MDD7970847.1 hypothetical protein [Roseinatronobacter sp. HJB301]